MLLKQRIQLNVRRVVIFVAVAILLTSSSAFAAKNDVNNNANTLKVSPVRSDVEILPGKSKSVQVTVTNLTKSPITVTPIENDFIAGDERGTPALILDANKFAPTHSLKRFMVPMKNVTIPAGRAVTVKVVINVPATAQAGGYFGAIRFAPASPDGGKQVNLSASVASLILLTVPGNIVERLTLTNFDIQQGGHTGTNFSSSNDLQVEARFRNDGNLQEGPFGQVSVKQGDKVVYTTDFNVDQPRGEVLPDSARRWDIPLKKIGSFGLYTVIGTFTYGAKNETIEVTKTFWVIPWSVIILTVVGLLLLIAFIVGMWLFLRSYKRRILNRHSHRGGYRR